MYYIKLSIAILLVLIFVFIGIFIICLTTLVLCMPNFFKDMPRNIFKKGKFKIYIYRKWDIVDSKPIYFNDVYNRLIFAYLSVRWEALKYDIKTINQEFGIGYGIEEIN